MQHRTPPAKSYFPAPDAWKGPRENDSGNAIYDYFMHTERYRWDFDQDFRADGWEQFDTDQDAHCFGIWVNRKMLAVFSYAEGDLHLSLAPNKEQFLDEIRSMLNFHGQSPAFVAIDPNAGTITEVYDDRERFLTV